ncbi:MAG: LamG-like jellyroll fold domain-containing protein [Planctomycetota bacterium]|jgi:hypothetical protein
MFKKLIWLVVLCSLLVPATSVSAELIGHWPLDGNPNDVSGNGNDGTAAGGVTYAEGVSGLAADFNGSNALIDCGDIPVGDTGAISIAFWVKPRNIAQNWAGFVSKWTLDNSQRTFWLGQHSTDGWLRFGFYPGGPTAETFVDSGQVILANEAWTHIVCSHDGNIQKIYADGVEIVASPERNAGIIDRGGNLRFGIVSTGNWFNGLIDDVRIYDHALSEAEVMGAMAGQPWPYALGPDPADGALLDATWTNLQWRPGDLAVSHDVYLGDSLDDVNQADRDSAAFNGNQTDTFLIVGFQGFPFPDGLVPGTTYYWRIDEVNDADPNSPWKGDVWSFWLPSKIAYDPSPSDGAMFVESGVELSWTAGWGGAMHTPYLGTDSEQVANAAGGTPQTDLTFDPGALTPGATYYWRIDEFDGVQWLKGDVWSFTTVPEIAVTDPNLVGWWQFDEGMGTTAVDRSGRGNHGTILGGAQWADGYHGGALQFDGGNDFVDLGNPPGLPSGAAPRSICAWATTDNLAGGWKVIVGYGSPAGSQSNGFARNGTLLSGFGYGNDLHVDDFWQTDVWYHFCLTYDGTTAILYGNGVQLLSEAKDWNLTLSRARIGRQVNEAAEFWAGLIDDVRIYDKVLTPEEIMQVMRGDPLLAWAPHPADGSTPDIDTALPLSWSPGDAATQHDVYFGTDADAVRDADSSDATGVYRGSQTSTSFTPAEGVEWGAGPFYWRIDENNTDGTVTAGRVWTFTVADFILVDDFESYTDNDPANEAIWQHWIDGYDTPANGSQVGHLVPPYAEQTIVHGGSQSMPLFYDNTGGVRNSEAELKLVAPRDWTQHVVAVVQRLSAVCRQLHGRSGRDYYDDRGGRRHLGHSRSVPLCVQDEDALRHRQHHRPSGQRAEHTRLGQGGRDDSRDTRSGLEACLRGCLSGQRGSLPGSRRRRFQLFWHYRGRHRRPALGQGGTRCRGQFYRYAFGQRIFLGAGGRRHSDEHSDDIGCVRRSGADEPCGSGNMRGEVLERDDNRRGRWPMAASGHRHTRQRPRTVVRVAVECQRRTGSGCQR